MFVIQTEDKHVCHCFNLKNGEFVCLFDKSRFLPARNSIKPLFYEHGAPYLFDPSTNKVYIPTIGNLLLLGAK
jgi:hypothetical protein